MANKYPNNKKMQEFKMKILKDLKQKEGDILCETPSSSSESMKKQYIDGFKSMTHLQQATDNLKKVTNDQGIFKVEHIYQVLNQLQKAEDPMAYKPEVDLMIERKKEREKKEHEELKRVGDILQKKKDEQVEHEKALFDFDEEINNLDQVEDRYPMKSTTTEDEQDGQVDIAKRKPLPTFHSKVIRPERP